MTDPRCLAGAVSVIRWLADGRPVNVETDTAGAVLWIEPPHVTAGIDVHDGYAEPYFEVER